MEVALVEKGASVPTAVETVVAGSVFQAEPDQKQRSRPMLRTPVTARAITHRAIEARVPVEAVQPVVREVTERSSMDREIQQQPNVHRSDSQEIVHQAEPRDRVTPAPRHEVSDIVSSQGETVVVPDAVTRPTAVVQPDIMQGQSELNSEPVLRPAISTPAADVGIDGHWRGTDAKQADAGQSVGSNTMESFESARISPPTAFTEGNQTPGLGGSSASTPGKGAGPDYGWLKRLLWERINRNKQYSDNALENEWEGRVVMVVTIRSDGHIGEVAVAESSGNRALDREAADLIARVSPVELDRPLGAVEVKLRVPISFGLE